MTDDRLPLDPSAEHVVELARVAMVGDGPLFRRTLVTVEVRLRMTAATHENLLRDAPLVEGAVRTWLDTIGRNAFTVHEPEAPPPSN